jgi:hypothetical protein
MERRFFLTTLFKGVVASTVAYSLPIVGKEFSVINPYLPNDYADRLQAIYYGAIGGGKTSLMLVPILRWNLRPGGYFSPL